MDKRNIHYVNKSKRNKSRKKGKERKLSDVLNERGKIDQPIQLLILENLKERYTSLSEELLKACYSHCEEGGILNAITTLKQDISRLQRDLECLKKNFEHCNMS